MFKVAGTHTKRAHTHTTESKVTAQQQFLPTNQSSVTISLPFRTPIPHPNLTFIIVCAVNSVLNMNTGNGGGVIVNKEFCFQEEIHFTVRKSCLFFPGDGFVVYDPRGELIFRVDSYGPDYYSMDELVLMDSAGKCLLSLHRKKPSLHRRWEGFLGEKTEGKGPLFSMHRSSIIGRSDVVVEVYSDPAEEYQIEGSFSNRSCNIYYTNPKFPLSKEPVAEIKQKVDPTTNVKLGKDVFLLCLKPKVDGAFVMGMVLVLDQMVGDGDDSFSVEPAVEDLSL